MQSLLDKFLNTFGLFLVPPKESHLNIFCLKQTNYFKLLSILLIGPCKSNLLVGFVGKFMIFKTIEKTKKVFECEFISE